MEKRQKRELPVGCYYVFLVVFGLTFFIAVAAVSTALEAACAIGLGLTGSATLLGLRQRRQSDV